ncbi:MAG TPA: 1-acyl-sn-glycerol-3-phosphate acyltransferase [Polyangiaceae bacterium]|jgi:glycerol-3-phosphate O-acyltransferase
MAKRELTRPYAPNPILLALYRRFFERIQVDEAWARSVKELAAQGSVVYVLRSLNLIDFLALDHLVKKHGLPAIRFVNDLGLWVLNPMSKGWLNAIAPKYEASPSEELEDALEHGGSAALFLKRPPGVLDRAAGASGVRGLQEGDELVRALLDRQRRSDRPILLVPQVFVWTKHPDKSATDAFDFVLGPRAWPSPTRTIGQFFYNYKHVELKLGEPISLADFLKDNPELPDSVLVRRLTYTVLRRLERERRVVTGPAEKAPDRLRSEIIRSPKLRAVIEDLADERTDRYTLTERALGMLSELQATPDQTTIKALEVIFDRVFTRIYAGIEYEKGDIERLRQAAKRGVLVLLPSHKSHIDYLILSYIFNAQNLPLPVIAAGDNLNFFPMGPIFRRGGAFFIRRSFRGDRLYAAVVDAYVRRLLRSGYPVELFLEGGRSRTGKLLAPKFGLLNMVADAALGIPDKECFFVPVSIGYERVIEAKSYERELQGGEKPKEDAAGLLKSREVLRHRYGAINMQVGQILTFDELRRELSIPPEVALTPAKRRSLVTRLGNRVMDEINRVTAVTPGALAALTLLCHERRGINHEDLVELCSKLLRVTTHSGARASQALRLPSGELRPESIREACQLFIDAELVEATLLDDPGRAERGRASSQATYTVPNNKRLSLDTSKNIIVHFFVERALVAMALLSSPTGERTSFNWVQTRVQELSRLFKFEFRFRADAPFEAIFQDTLRVMFENGEVSQNGDELSAGAGRDNLSGEQWLRLYASILRNFIEGYWVAARALEHLEKVPLAEKELTKRALALGNRLFLAAAIERPEAVSKTILQNAFQAFVDQGYLAQRDNKLDLGEGVAARGGLSNLAQHIRNYFPGGPA